MASNHERLVFGNNSSQKRKKKKKNTYEPRHRVHPQSLGLTGSAQAEFQARDYCIDQTITKFSNVIGYQQPDLSINWTVWNRNSCEGF